MVKGRSPETFVNFRADNSKYVLYADKYIDCPDSFSGNYGMEQEDDEGEDLPQCFGEPEGVFCYICRFRKECEMNSIRQAS